MSFKIAFIGAGSLVFARTLFTDIMSVPELRKAEISFTDINPDNLEKQERFARETLTQTKFRLRFRQQQTEERHLKMRVIS